MVTRSGSRSRSSRSSKAAAAPPASGHVSKAHPVKASARSASGMAAEATGAAASVVARSSAGSAPAAAAVRHIFLTGQPGVGKTTLVRTIFEKLLNANPEVAKASQGFYTEEVRGGGARTGFDIVSLPAGERGVLSRMQQAAGAALAGRKGAPTVGAYIVDVPSLEALALPQLAVAPVGGTRSGAGRAAAAAPATTAAAAPLRRLVVIDEVGKMELKSPRFFPAVLAALDSGASGTTVFGTVPMPRYGHVVPEVEQVKARPDVAVVSVTKANRDELADSVYRQLRRCMGLTPPT